MKWTEDCIERVIRETRQHRVWSQIPTDIRDDFVQEVFFEVHSVLRELTSNGDVAKFFEEGAAGNDVLRRACSRVAKRIQRSTSKTPLPLIADTLPAMNLVSPQDAAERAEFRALILRSKHLSPRRRRILGLHLDGASDQEIAERLGVDDSRNIEKERSRICGILQRAVP